MEIIRLPGQNRQITVPPNHHRQQGFALVSLTVLLPLAFALVGAIAYVHLGLKRKSLAQALCVSVAVRSQTELAKALEALLKLNPHASHLRQERTQAEARLKLALVSGVPPAIAAARAQLTAVVLAQTAMRGQQQRILLEAEVTRDRFARELRGQTRQLQVAVVKTAHGYVRALAVRPAPAGDASPDYVLRRPFARLQAQHFEFAVDLRAPTAGAVQTTACSTTLSQQEDLKWKAQIITASAPSRPL